MAQIIRYRTTQHPMTITNTRFAVPLSTTLANATRRMSVAIARQRTSVIAQGIIGPSLILLYRYKDSILIEKTDHLLFQIVVDDPITGKGPATLFVATQGSNQIGVLYLLIDIADKGARAMCDEATSYKKRCISWRVCWSSTVTMRSNPARRKAYLILRL
jgi:hypothetical protein